MPNEFLKELMLRMMEDAKNHKNESYANDEDFEPVCVFGWDDERPPELVSLVDFGDLSPVDALMLLGIGMTVILDERPHWAITAVDAFCSKNIEPGGPMPMRGELGQRFAAGDPTVSESVMLVGVRGDWVLFLERPYSSEPDCVFWGEVSRLTESQGAMGDIVSAMKFLLTGP